MCDFDDKDALEELFGAPDKPLSMISPKVADIPTVEELMTCKKCNGTGTWSPRPSIARTCFTCKGSGKLTKERFNRVEGAKRAARTRAANLSEYRDDHAELIRFMEMNSHWNDFFASMVERVQDHRMTEKQEAACYRIMNKTLESRAAKEASKPKISNLSSIHDLFNRALANGKKRRALLGAHFSDDSETVTHVIKITPAANKPVLWVKVDNEFCGGIQEDGSTRFNRHAPVWLTEDLQRIADNPLDEARLYGRVTGTCCCCARELTDPESIKEGIGPICKSKWF